MTTATKAQTPRRWTRGSIRTHIGASHQVLLRVRTELVEAAGTEGADIGQHVVALGDWLKAEYEWIEPMSEVPPHMRRTDRASFMKSYSTAVEKLARDLTKAVEQGATPTAWEPVGVAMLAVLAHAQGALRMR